MGQLAAARGVQANGRMGPGGSNSGTTVQVVAAKVITTRAHGNGPSGLTARVNGVRENLERKGSVGGEERGGMSVRVRTAVMRNVATNVSTPNVHLGNGYQQSTNAPGNSERSQRFAGKRSERHRRSNVVPGNRGTHEGWHCNAASVG